MWPTDLILLFGRTGFIYGPSEKVNFFTDGAWDQTYGVVSRTKIALPKEDNGGHRPGNLRPQIRERNIDAARVLDKLRG